jgi:hypothetical protein
LAAQIRLSDNITERVAPAGTTFFWHTPFPVVFKKKLEFSAVGCKMYQFGE